MTFDYQMEFVGDKKIACFCGAPKCSGMIGEKLKEVKEEKKPATKRKWKIKPLATKVAKPEPESGPESESEAELQPQPKKQRQIEETTDPIAVVIERVQQYGCTIVTPPPMDSQDSTAVQELPPQVHHVTGEDELEELPSADA